MATNVHGIDEVEITIQVQDGKFRVESRSGPKSGSIKLGTDGMDVELILEGADTDRAVADLTGPELGNFRTIVDAALSSVALETENPALDSDSLFSGYVPLRMFGGETGVIFDRETLQALNLVTEDGSIPGGTRQIQCTVMGDGTAILNLTGGERSMFG